MQSPFKFNLSPVLATFISLFSLMCSAQAQTLDLEAKWTLASKNQNVAVYQRHTQDNHLEVRGVTQIHAVPDDFLQLLDDTQNASKWIANCQNVTVLNALDSNTRIVHTKFNAPWPIEDRDMVTKSVSYYTNDILHIDITDMGDQYPLTQGYVRIQHISGQWVLKPVTQGLLSIEYIGRADPGGKIPTWLANRTLISSMGETFENIHKQLDNASGSGQDF